MVPERAGGAAARTSGACLLALAHGYGLSSGAPRALVDCCSHQADYCICVCCSGACASQESVLMKLDDLMVGFIGLEPEKRTAFQRPSEPLEHTVGFQINCPSLRFANLHLVGSADIDRTVKQKKQTNETAGSEQFIRSFISRVLAL